MGAALEIKDLTVRGEDGQTLLSIPEFALTSGFSLGVSGPSGAGKSTFLHAVAGLLNRVKGEVLWDGKNILKMGSDARARFRADHVGMVFQDFLLFDELGPEDNAALVELFRPQARTTGVRARAAETLANLGVPATARTVASFSGGERQRVAVARAVSNAPDILLADEPTASLHREAADQIAEDLITLSRTEGRTLIVVSHDEAILSRMDRRLVIADGQIANEDWAA